MPVLKIYKNGVWEDVAGPSGHTHTTSDIMNFPSSLPADGGDADTLDGKHASDFLTISDITSLDPETIGADPIGTAETKMNAHNINSGSHIDIRLLITELSTRLNVLADSDDITLDQLSEIVTYIKSNKSLIDAITTNKISYNDIIDNLETNVSNKPLSAKQGVALKALIDAIVVPTALSQLTQDSTHKTVTDAEKETWNNKMNSSDLQSGINTALAQAKASGEFDGDDGTNGISATHSWNGTILTVTSASGTSSADLKGEKGDKGDQGEPGAKGDQGIQGIQGEPGAKGDKGDKGDTGAAGANGKDGTNGVSCTHSWNGTTLTVTSASGTSSANLKGEKGEQGIQGIQGIQGEPGAKGDKGEKGDTGATGANGQNGKDGADGKTPVKGTDYYTEADKTEMVSRVLSALPTWTGGNY